MRKDREVCLHAFYDVYFLMDAAFYLCSCFGKHQIRASTPPKKELCAYGKFETIAFFWEWMTDGWLVILY
jgi:hypothetical protein